MRKHPRPDDQFWSKPPKTDLPLRIEGRLKIIRHALSRSIGDHSYGYSRNHLARQLLHDRQTLHIGGITRMGQRAFRFWSTHNVSHRKQPPHSCRAALHGVIKEPRVATNALILILAPYQFCNQNPARLQARF